MDIDTFMETYYNNFDESTLDSNKTSEPIKEKILENKPYKKKKPPQSLKQAVWNKYVPEDIGRIKCLCCNSNYITPFTFHCGHIIAESKGGKTNIDNLRPICSNCNSSMGTKNMNEFKNDFF